jgi:4-hydroxy-tetrahydrodipicolinate reductase
VIGICVAGATGWVGTALIPAIEEAADLELVGAVARGAASRPLVEENPAYRGELVVEATVAEALERRRPDVLIEYTAPRFAREHALGAMRRGVHVVIGTSGLDEEDFEALDTCAREHEVGCLAAGNFAISAVLLQRFAEMAARHLPTWEVIDYSDPHKPDAPSGTARELVRRVAEVARPRLDLQISDTEGYPEARGLAFHGTQVHSVRVPGFVLGVEAIFGKPDERLTLRYDAGGGAEPYVAGTLLAARSVNRIRGLARGLDAVLEDAWG